MEQVDIRLNNIFKNKLLHQNLINKNDIIVIEKIHLIKQHGQPLYHHIVSVRESNKKYLVRSLKENDNTYSILGYLSFLNYSYRNVVFPCALTSPFTVDNQSFIITTYTEGKNLEAQLDSLSDEELLDVSSSIDYCLKVMHSVTNNRYSNGLKQWDNSFANIMIQKFSNQMNNPYSIFYKNIDKKRFLEIVKSILQNSTFSKPTMVHMDIKPANIIISKDKKVSLIDYELSRFADIDFEWTNLIIKTLHPYNDRFIKYTLNPIIEKNFIPLEKALLDKKSKLYLLYLAVNKYIYCCKCEKTCPIEIFDLINTILKDLL